MKVAKNYFGEIGKSASDIVVKSMSQESLQKAAYDKALASKNLESNEGEIKGSKDYPIQSQPEGEFYELHQASGSQEGQPDDQLEYEENENQMYENKEEEKYEDNSKMNSIELQPGQSEEVNIEDENALEGNEDFRIKFEEPPEGEMEDDMDNAAPRHGHSESEAGQSEQPDYSEGN